MKAVQQAWIDADKKLATDDKKSTEGRIRKPCLFCGTSEAKSKTKQYLVSYRVECFCGMSGPYGDTKEDAERYWDMLKT